ncbi:benzoate/H(+) symporter BenE family transporter [Tabrizicola sp.]|uniref:benzoate/H(+) symporter BenE family transporter n=1 Tax=Tabrizicola sp. TaxID=2005166 RepID=UPI002619B7D2|nr:benzoate/H(+) symporter BenE family transporter [Tabrizicola sp.]MDM7933475.1 benzoate/H(+) symporter BenE family transporter [Tabrizicola sp.]
MRLSVISAAVVAALVGYAASVAIVLAAALALGATSAQAASWLLAVSLGKAVGSAVLSWQSKVPVVLAWSTPGAALIAATSGISLAEGVGAFILAGALIAATGLIRPLGALVARIPDGIAAGMLAGVLLPFCLKGAGAAEALPGIVLPMVAVFLVVRLVSPALAVLASFGAGIVLALIGGADLSGLGLSAPVLVPVLPEFRLSVILGLGVPLYLVTMASQNLPGFATLRAAGYEPPVVPALTVTGLISGVTAFFGAHTVSMAAITAAICLGPDVHPDKDRRWVVGLAYAGAWVVLGLLSPTVLALLAALPGPVVVALVALALLSPLTGALAGAFAAPDQRFAATLTLAVTASGVAAFGIGAAFWGLVAGLAVFRLERFRR